VERRGCVAQWYSKVNPRGNEPVDKTKPFDISKWVVYEAYLRVKANRGAAGVDDESVEDFEKNLKRNLYKIWNRMSSGTYFPPPVLSVEIPKNDGKGGIRRLGVPTVSDRIAQTVVKLYLEPEVEPLFHSDSYGYRPKKSALDAVAKARERCWKNDWVLELDIVAFFDRLDHSLVMEEVKKHTSCKWILLYIERWLKAPLQMKDGTLMERNCGSPQGSVISPLISNIFMHHVFDMWMQEEVPNIPFERYADDAIAHCRTEKQARYIRDRIAKRLAQYGLELHPDKTRIVYCKDVDRRGSYEHEQFDFLGYLFRPRLSKNRHGKHFVNFTPAVSEKARKAISREIRSWNIQLRSDKSIGDLAQMFNKVVQGWINYYGRFYKSRLYPILRHLNDDLVLWARKKYKRLRSGHRRAKKWIAQIAQREPNLFAHWRFGVKPDGWAMGAG
jgi:RNA-directed DNA polymerase